MDGCKNKWLGEWIDRLMNTLIDELTFLLIPRGI